MKKYTDAEILAIIQKLLDGEGDEDQIESWFDNELYQFMPGISDLIFFSKKALTPEEILERARESSRPIQIS